nr:hypothetical protein [Burkholderia cepacia]
GGVRARLAPGRRAAGGAGGGRPAPPPPGLAGDAVRAFLASGEGLDAVVALEEAAVRDGIASVPSTRIGSTVVSGAQPADVFRAALLDAQRARDRAA